jgi:hypothetical protein
MREHRISVTTVKDFNLVLVKASRGTKVEVPGVLISKSAVFNFCPLTPVDSPAIINFTNLGFGERAQTSGGARGTSRGHGPPYAMVPQAKNYG